MTKNKRDWEQASIGDYSNASCYNSLRAAKRVRSLDHCNPDDETSNADVYPLPPTNPLDPLLTAPKQPPRYPVYQEGKPGRLQLKKSLIQDWLEGVPPWQDHISSLGQLEKDSPILYVDSDRGRDGHNGDKGLQGQSGKSNKSARIKRKEGKVTEWEIPTPSLSTTAAQQAANEEINMAPRRQKHQSAGDMSASRTGVMQRTSSQDSFSHVSADAWTVVDSITTSNTQTSASKHMIRQPLYREVNLAGNNLFLRDRSFDLPDHIVRLVSILSDQASALGRDAMPTLSQDERLHLQQLEQGASEEDIASFSKKYLFPNPSPLDPVKICSKLPLQSHAMPVNPGSSAATLNPIIRPAPDMLFGYHRTTAFHEPHLQELLISLGAEPFANSMALMYPFLTVEFKASLPSGSGGGLWVAVNQAIGGASACVRLADYLRHRLDKALGHRHQGRNPEQEEDDEREDGEQDQQQLQAGAEQKGEHEQAEDTSNKTHGPSLDTAAFSVVYNGTEARIHITWLDNETTCYNTVTLQSFLLTKLEDYHQFVIYVRNIVNWGTNKRLNDIKRAITAIGRTQDQRGQGAGPRLGSRQQSSRGNGDGSVGDNVRQGRKRSRSSAPARD